MGDLTENNMEVDESEDDKILRRVEQLGEYKDKDGVRQLFIKSDDDSVIALAVIWSDFRTLLDSNLIQNESNVLQTLLRYTAWIIFDGRYSQKVNSACKLKLTDSFRSISISGKESNESRPLERICGSLVPLSETPWTGDVFKAATSGEINGEAITDLWQQEGWVLIETRIETMGRIKKLPTIETIGRLLYVCASKGNIWTESDVSTELEPVTSVFDAFKYNINEYCDLLENCILFWGKSLVDIQFLSSLPIPIILKTLTRLNERSSSARQSRLLPRLWTKENVKTLVLKFVNNWVPAVLRNRHEISYISDLYEYWLEVNLESITEEEYVAKVKSTVETASVALEFVHSTSYIYTLASLLLNKLKESSDAATTREMYVELFLRGLIIDINRIEKSRADVPVDSAKVQSLCESLATRLLELSEYFIKKKETSRSLLLTSFSLKPSKELFDKLFPAAVDVVNASDSSELCDTEEEDLQLPEYLCNDLSTVIFKPRWSALGRNVKGDELKEMCKKLLNEDFSWLSTGRKNAELKYVNVNYELYSHLPSKYDPNDDGIEKGFTLSGKRKPKSLLIGKRRVVQGLKRINGGKGKSNAMMKVPLKPVNRGRANWIKAPGGVKRGTTTATPKRSYTKANRTESGVVKPARVNSGPVVKGPKKKPGKKPRHPEVDEKLNKVTQYLRQIETVKAFFGAAELTTHPKTALSSRLKKLKQHYVHGYCTEANNIPGHVEVVPYPTAYKNKAKGNYMESVRKKPTGYICPATPFQLRLQDSNEFDFEFRLNREVFPKKVIDVYKSRFSKQQQHTRRSTIQNILPDKSNYARWSMCGDDFNVGLISSDNKASSTFEILAEQRKALTKVKKTVQLEKSELIKLQTKYNKFKENYSNLHVEEPGEDPVNLPSALHVIIPMTEIKSAAQNGKDEEVEVPQAAGPPPESAKSTGPAVLNIIITAKKDEDVTKNETPPVPLALAPPTPPPSLPVKLDAYVGDLIEIKSKRNMISVPPGPKHQQDAIRLGIMLEDTCKRVQNNLDCETFKYPHVQNEHKKETESLRILSGKDCNPQRIDDLQLPSILDSMKVHLSHTPSEFSSRGRRRKQANCTSSCCGGGGGGLVEDVAREALEEKFAKLKRYGKSYSRRTALPVRKRKAKSGGNSSDANSETAADVNVKKRTKSTNDESSSSVPNVNVPVINSPYVVPKGASQFDEILRQVTTAEFIEAIENLSEPEDTSPIKGSTFKDRFALKVWKLYSENKNVSQIQQELKCSWNPVNRRINDQVHVDRVIQILHRCSPTFKEKFDERSKLPEPPGTSNAEPSKDAPVKDPADADGNKSSNENNVVQSEPEVPNKPKFQILFPLLQNPSIRRTGELVAKAPIEFPKAPTVIKQVLDELTGELVDVSVPFVEDEEEDPPNIKAALLIPWPEEDDNSKGDDDDHIRQLEAEHFKLLDEKNSYDTDYEDRPKTPPPRLPPPPVSVTTVPPTTVSADDSSVIQKSFTNESKSATDDAKSEPQQIISVTPIAPTSTATAPTKAAELEQETPRALKRKPKPANARVPRKRKPPDSPENYSEASSSSTSSSYSVVSSSSSYEEIVKEKPRPRSRRTLRKRTIKTEEKEKPEDNLVRSSSPEPEKSPEQAKRIKIRRCSVLLRTIPPEELEKYTKPANVANENVPTPPPSPSPPAPQRSKGRPGLRKKKVLKGAAKKSNVIVTELNFAKQSNGTNGIGVSPSVTSNGVVHDSSSALTPAPIIIPVEVNIQKKKVIKVQSHSFKPAMLTKDPLRSSYSPTAERVIEEITITSSDEDEVNDRVTTLKLPSDHTNGLSHLSQVYPSLLMQMSFEEEGQEEHHPRKDHNGFPGINGYLPIRDCEYSEPSEMIIAESSHPDQQDSDYVTGGNVNNIHHEAYLPGNSNNIEQDYQLPPANDNASHEIEEEDFATENENNVSNNSLHSPIGQTSSPEAILGLNGDSSTSYHDHSCDQNNLHVVETVQNNNNNINTETRVLDFEEELSQLDEYAEEELSQLEEQEELSQTQLEEQQEEQELSQLEEEEQGLSQLEEEEQELSQSEEEEQELMRLEEQQEEQELSQLELEDEEIRDDDGSNEQFQSDSDSPSTPPYSPLGDETLPLSVDEEIPELASLAEPDPPFLMPEDQIDIEEITEPVSPPRLHKYDVVDSVN